MKMVDIYTDGACSGNPGVGGWAAVLIYGEIRKEIYGGEIYTTNNRMEITAAIKALEALTAQCNVNVHSDSSYLINAFEKGWLNSWQKSDWKKADKKPVENDDLWKQLLQLCKKHNIHWIKVKGHSIDAENNRCDKLATNEVKRIKQRMEKEEDE